MDVQCIRFRDIAPLKHNLFTSKTLYMLRKPANVVMVPSEKQKGLIPNNSLVTVNGKLMLLESYKKDSITDHYFFKGGVCLRRDSFTFIQQDLFFTVDDKIDENEDVPVLVELTQGWTTNYEHARRGYKSVKRIVATNNQNMWALKKRCPECKASGKKPFPKNCVHCKGSGITQSKGLPRIPVSFLQVFVEANGKLEKVLLDYSFRNDGMPYVRRDSTVVVHPFKERMYFRDEMNDAVLQACAGVKSGLLDSVKDVQDYFDKYYPQF
jgi:hypothetical protein